MAVEVFKSPHANSNYSFASRELLYLATVFSQSSHFNIIDSFTTHWWQNRPYWTAPPDPQNAQFVDHRYKGDPIADTEQRPGGSMQTLPVWEDTNDLDSENANCWFIIECQTEHPDLAALGYTGLPKWQAKIQIMGNASNFKDPSDPTGVKYPVNHLGNRDTFWRFCPWGGWDLADVTPDFTNHSGPASPQCSSENRRASVGHFGSGDDTRDYLIMDDGYLIRWSRRNEDAMEPMSLSLVLGDVLPVHSPGMPNHMVMPRAMKSSTSSNPLTSMYWPPLASTTYDFINSDYGIGVTFWDDLVSKVEDTYHMAPAGKYLLDERTSPSPYGTYPEVDLFPVTVVPYSTPWGPRFTFPGVRVGQGIGIHPVANKQWISTHVSDTCYYIRWDGTSDIY